MADRRPLLLWPQQRTVRQDRIPACDRLHRPEPGWPASAGYGDGYGAGLRHWHAREGDRPAAQRRSGRSDRGAVRNLNYGYDRGGNVTPISDASNIGAGVHGAAW